MRISVFFMIALMSAFSLSAQAAVSCTNSSDRGNEKLVFFTSNGKITIENQTLVIDAAANQLRCITPGKWTVVPLPAGTPLIARQYFLFDSKYFASSFEAGNSSWHSKMVLPLNSVLSASEIQDLEAGKTVDLDLYLYMGKATATPLADPSQYEQWSDVVAARLHLVRKKSN